MQRYKIIIHFTLLAVALWATTSCTADHPESSRPAEDTATITMTIKTPGEGYSPTRAMTEAHESDVQHIDALLFKPDGSGIISVVPAENITAGSDSRHKNFRISVPPAQYDIVLIANAKEEIAMAVFEGKTKDEAVASLKKKWPDGGKWPTDGSMPFPMWGEAGTVNVTENMKITQPVQMMRMVARIDVQLTGKALDNFRITGVEIYNYYDTVMIAPLPEHVVTIAGKKTVTFPYLYPPMLDKYIQGPVRYEVDDPQGATKLEREIYIGETDSYDWDMFGREVIFPPHMRMAIVVEGIWDRNMNGDFTDDEPSYYRLDFTEQRDGERKIANVLRNHWYILSISEVNGLGYLTSSDALNHKPDKMVHQYITWDEDMENTLYDGRFVLGIAPFETSFGMQADQGSIQVKTDAPSFRFELSTSPTQVTTTKPGWIKFIPAAGTDIPGRKDGVSLEYTISHNQNLSGMPSRKAYIHITPYASQKSIVAEIHQDGMDAPVMQQAANCYMVDTDATPLPIAIPVWEQVSRAMAGFGGGVRGNTSPDADAVLDSDWLKLKGKRWNVGVLWSDREMKNPQTTTVNGVEFYGDYESDITSTDKAYILVYPTSNEGNTVVFLYDDKNGDGIYDPDDGDEIKWSWHVWNTPYQPRGMAKPNSVSENGPVQVIAGVVYKHMGINRKNIFMDRNLGATNVALFTDNTINPNANKVGTYGLLYQWGRKDPFMGAGTISNQGTMPHYYPSNSKAVHKSETHEVNSFVSSVKNPLTLYAMPSLNPGQSYDWFTTSAQESAQNHNLWGSFQDDDQGKTVFDPCPPGWRVPLSISKVSIHDNSAWAAPGATPGSYDKPTYYTLHPFNNGYYFDNSVPHYHIGWYPAAGYRNELGFGIISSGGQGGCYWSATVSQYGGSLIPSAFTFNAGVINPIFARTKIFSYSVRCVAE